MWLEIVLFLASTVLLVVLFFHQSYQYWKRRGVPTLQRKFLLGNANTFLPKGFSVGTITKDFYNEFKKQGQRLGGVYLVTEPNLVLTDPELIKDVLTKDFHDFVNRGIYYNKKDDPLSAHLFALDGSDWKNLRVKLTPTFTSGKMKIMFGTVLDCSKYMVEAMEQNLDQDLDIKEYLGRFTTDVIGSCAFGIDCNSFKHPDATFRKMGKRHFQYGFLRSLRSFVILSMPKLALKLGFSSNRASVREFFKKIVSETVQFREEKKIRRNDFLQILMDLNETEALTIDEMTAQAFLFFLAGFETSSSVMTHTLHQLSLDLKLQNQLRQEIEMVLAKSQNKITYESLKEMKLLAQVIDESLRMYPSVTTINRRCIKRYTFKDTNVTIDEDTNILIPVLGLHMDPEFFPDPETFKPERFTEENKAQRNPFVYLPFGQGPRNCIGLRFGLMQTKIGIIEVLRKFELSPSPKTKTVELNPYTFLLQTVNPIYVRAMRI